ncbi:IclR family transcriptional regulator C-terminal domain-containing protein [Streptomyces sp. NPDC001568]|uniref:IclR family transcriptional regulator domain-containing protein n=1 Tax=Streptomyces sp. NPDC001568 TaxID=3364588 RepID=UPI0036B84E89
MTDVSRYDDHHGGAGRPEPVVPAALAELLAHLAGPADFWDRPDGDFGPLSRQYALSEEEREHANTMYRLGSKALRREDLLRAADCLGAAAEAGHPGALFRMAALVARAGRGREDVRFLVAEAARHGHGDARHLLAESSRGLSSRMDVSRGGEDPLYAQEIGRALSGARPPAAAPLQGAGFAASGAQDPAAEGEKVFRESPTGAGRLVLVPSPRVGQYLKATDAVRPAGDGGDVHGRGEYGPGGRPGLRPVPGKGTSRLVLPPTVDEPDLSPFVTVPGREGPACWSVHALRPAKLNDLARGTPVHCDTPRQWEAAARALDILYLVDGAEGITSRTLSRRTGLSATAVAWLLHWLRSQQYIDTVAGAHHPGPLMKMAHDPAGRGRLLQQTLDSLRDEIGAAVYASGYIDGDIDVFRSASSATAPPVEQWVDFRDCAHASAVGKSLLAQLDFDGRMNHLARYRPVQLTQRTITSPRTLFETLDGHGPHAAQFDLLEYSHREVCAAFPLGIPGRATAVALSLPATEHHRLLSAATALSERCAGLLLTLLLTHDTPYRSTPHSRAHPTNTPWRTPKGTSVAALALP